MYHGTEIDYDGNTDSFWDEDYVMHQIDILIEKDFFDADDEGVAWDDPEDFRDLDF